MNSLCTPGIISYYKLVHCLPLCLLAKVSSIGGCREQSGVSPTHPLICPHSGVKVRPGGHGLRGGGGITYSLT